MNFLQKNYFQNGFVAFCTDFDEMFSKHLKYGEKALQFVVILLLERAFESLWVRLAQLVECMAVMVEVAVSNLSECRSP